MSIELQGVSKRFRRTCAVEHVCLTLEPGRIYGLLGRNGAGKTTLLNLITGRIFPDEGEILIDGETALERDEAQEKVFYVGEHSYYPGAMTVRDVFLWAGRFYPGFDRAQAGRLSDRFGLDTKKRLDTLSTGYRSIVGIILALSVGTPYVLLDEPVLGLDAYHREQFYKELLDDFSRRPETAFVLSTHLIEEVSGVIDRVVILKDGRILEDTDCEALLSQGYTLSGPAGLVDRFAAGRRKLGEDTLGGLKSAYLLGQPPAELPEGLEISTLRLQKLFVELTGEEERA